MCHSASVLIVLVGYSPTFDQTRGTSWGGLLYPRVCQGIFQETEEKRRRKDAFRSPSGLSPCITPVEVASKYYQLVM